MTFTPKQRHVNVNTFTFVQTRYVNRRDAHLTSNASYRTAEIVFHFHRFTFIESASDHDLPQYCDDANDVRIAYYFHVASRNESKSESEHHNPVAHFLRNCHFRCYFWQCSLFDRLSGWKV